METTQVFESILFTNIVEREFYNNKVSQIVPIAKYVGAELGIDIKTNFETIASELVKRIKLN